MSNPRKLFILHFQPIEGYPPILNLLSFLSGKKSLSTTIITTKGNFGYQYSSTAVSTLRLGKIGNGIKLIFRWITYIRFNLLGLAWLIAMKPEVILYYESISAWPGIFYKKFLNRNVRLYIHYHEYTTPKEYASGMSLVRYFHKLEKTIYSKSAWISHTNSFRMEKFIRDENLRDLDMNIFKVMPNYPPKIWKTPPKTQKNTNRTRLVYVGYSLSFSTMYVQEVIDWVEKNSGLVSLDFYLHTIPGAVIKQLKDNQIENIRVLPAIAYEKMPFVLREYNAGLIIYKGAIENYIYIAPNKLFEYLTCGLDVWLPNVMKGALEYVCEEERPRVLALDFLELDHYSKDYLLGSKDLPLRNIDYFCEPIYENLYQQIIA